MIEIYCELVKDVLQYGLVFIIELRVFSKVKKLHIMWRKIKRLAMKYDDCQLYREKIFLFFHDATYVKKSSITTKNMFGIRDALISVSLHFIYGLSK